ncbi:MAG: L,D-transpeptidase family protein, partial [Bacillota bacterium]
FRRLLKGGVSHLRGVKGESSVRQGKQVAGTASAAGAAPAAGTPSGSTPGLVRATGGAATPSPAKVTGTASAVATGPQRTIVISVGERALGLYEGDRLVRRYPVAIGKPSTPTPVGTHRILEKVMHPGGGLGTRWMAFTYEMHGIHGTNRPELIGQAVSNGCVRMHNENVEELYDMVDVGTPVAVIVGALEAWPGLGKPAGTGAGQPAAQGPGLGGPAAGPGGSGQGGSTAQPGGGTGQGAGAVPAPTGGTGMPGGGLGTPGSPQPKDAQAGRTYTVQPGDSLWSIAQRFATTVAAIVAANNIRNPDLIYPGEVLRIP